MNVYDFDKTIYSGDSSVDFFLFELKKNPGLLRYLPKQLFAFVRYFLRKIDKNTLKESFFSFLNSIDGEREAVAFWEKNKEKIYIWYLAQKKADDVVISASPEFLLLPICEHLGIGCLIASKVDPKTGRFLGNNCRGKEKVIRYREQFQKTAIENFYSDSYSDAPMAQLAENAFLIRQGNVNVWDTQKGD